MQQHVYEMQTTMPTNSSSDWLTFAAKYCQRVEKESVGMHVFARREDTIRYDTIQYIYVRSKADEMASLI